MFMLNRFEIRLIGSVSMVIMVSVNSVWLFFFVMCVCDLFCISLMCFCSVVMLFSISVNFLLELLRFCRLVVLS